MKVSPEIHFFVFLLGLMLLIGAATYSIGLWAGLAVFGAILALMGHEGM